MKATKLEHAARVGDRWFRSRTDEELETIIEAADSMSEEEFADLMRELGYPEWLFPERLRRSDPDDGQ